MLGKPFLFGDTGATVTANDVAKESAARASSPVARALPIVLAVTIGVAMGIGGYTFRYAEGLSYLQVDPKACVNCHIMRPEYDAWQNSSHHQVAVCVPEDHDDPGDSPRLHSRHPSARCVGRPGAGPTEHSAMARRLAK